MYSYNYMIRIHGPVRHYILANVLRAILDNYLLYGVDCVVMSPQVFYRVLWSHSDNNIEREYYAI